MLKLFFFMFIMGSKGNHSERETAHIVYRTDQESYLRFWIIGIKKYEQSQGVENSPVGRETTRNIAGPVVLCWSFYHHHLQHEDMVSHHHKNATHT